MEATPPVKSGIGRTTIALTVMAVMIVILAGTSVYAYALYQNQVDINSNENGIPKTMVTQCVFDTSTHVPWVTVFESQLPQWVGNVSISGGGLVSWWPYAYNATHFKLFTIWDMNYFHGKNYQNTSVVEVLYTRYCRMNPG
jgi:hypothetical protein